MAEKRFTLTNPKNTFQEMKCGIDDRGNTLTFNDVVDLLNEQHETIQRFKQNIDELLSVNVEEELLKENEQLKQQIEELEFKLRAIEAGVRTVKVEYPNPVYDSLLHFINMGRKR